MGWRSAFGGWVQAAVVLFVVASVSIAVVVGLKVAFHPPYRVELFGEWGWSALMSPDEKADFINTRYGEFGLVCGLHCRLMIVPYSGEWIIFDSEDPLGLVLRVDRSTFGRTEHDLPQVREGVFLYESPTYPIDIEITVVDEGDDFCSPHIRMEISAQPRGS